MNKLFIDTNIFYNILFETTYTPLARRILEENSSAKYYTSAIIVNELLYISTFKYFRDKGIVKGKLDLRKTLVKHGYPKEIVKGITGLLDELGVEVLHDKQDVNELVETAILYRLLPSDAQVAITCKHYNINTIATLDKDFKRIPWLKTIP